ncbi:MAG: TonB family protein [Bacteriovorax sp.]|nr:TonB family protein [Bacteriovorax sp.]
MKLFRKERTKISLSLIFSLILHMGFLAFAAKEILPPNFFAPKLATSSAAQKPNTIRLDEIKFLSKKQLAAIKENHNRQIVASEDSGKKEKPLNTRFAGEKDQTFDRQTIAAANGIFKEAGKGKKEGSKSTLEQVEPVLKKVAVAQSKSKNFHKELTLSDLGGFTIADAAKMVKEVDESFEQATKKLGEEKKSAALGVERGKAGVNGLALNNDFVEEVPLGDMTNLNTTEFKYYGFYHRIRQKLEQHWGSSIKDKAKNLYRSGRRMPASENLITSVTVILDDHGQIVDMQIEGTSGVRELDQAAIESFNKAGPFPNPPKGLLVGGRATIQWGFVVKS